ncbi:MAG TPA: hypothetical protein VM324_12370 [Egibacteraceae bacterium]|nr:hypothetical protein [Egibacteraceae bacterium]
MAEGRAGDVPLRAVATGLSLPTSVAFDEDGGLYVAEAGLPFGGASPGGRVVRLGAAGQPAPIVDSLRPPVTGLTFHRGGLYVSEGGHPARISRLDLASGSLSVVVDGLPGPGNYHTNMTVLGPDEKLYFSQGAMTNSGIVGPDAYEVGWLGRLPHAHDVPGYDVVLTGENATTLDPTAASDDATAVTGAFSPFGTATRPGQRVAAGLPATAAVMRCDPDGGGLELVAWGLRNAFGLGFLPDGRLLATDQGADDRGSRPIGNGPDLLFEVRQGAWYGWPDFIGGKPVTDPRYRPQRGPAPRFLLANHDQLPQPQRPLLAFPAHAAAVKFAVIPPGRPRAGHLIVALFGDERPMTAGGGPRVGRCLARIDPDDWSLHPLCVGPLLRPIDVAVHGPWLYALDFGWFEMTADGVDARAGSGRVWRIRLDDAVSQ